MLDKRDHIFISYATEQWPLCEWLGRQLAARGYAIWCDRLKILGGEDWPKDIDVAIRDRTFRMIALLSQASMSRPNPQGEWLKGRAIGNKIGIDDFVIPLNTEGLRPDQITWNLQTTNFIPFSPSWADGLAALLKKIRSINAPRVLRNGPQLAVESLGSTTAVREEPEVLLSNCFEIIQIPRYIRTYIIASDPLSLNRRRAMRRQWACRDVSPTKMFAFDDPPPSVAARHSLHSVRQDAWCDMDTLDGIDSRDLIVSLVHRCLDRLMEAAGMEYSEVGGRWYLPSGLLQSDRVPVTYPNGTKRWFRGVGERKYPTPDGGEVYRYHLSPSFRMLRNQVDPYILYLQNHVQLTDLHGTALQGQKIQSRRKHLCKMWFNKQWCARTLGMAQLLAGGDEFVRFGPAGEQQLVVNATPIALDAPRSIRDELVEEPDETYTIWNDGDEAGPGYIAADD